MPLTRRQFLAGAAAAGAAVAAAGCTPEWMAGLDEKPSTATMPSPTATNAPYSTGPIAWTPTPPANVKPPSAVALALRRMTFGLRPGDVERVSQLGLDKYIDQQLHPESIDDSALEKMLQAFPTLTLGYVELLQGYPQPKPQ